MVSSWRRYSHTPIFLRTMHLPHNHVRRTSPDTAATPGQMSSGSETEDAWEDIHPRANAQPSPADTRTTPRRRRTVYITTSSRRQLLIPASPSSNTGARTRRTPEVPRSPPRPPPPPFETNRSPPEPSPPPRKPAYEPVFTLTREELANGFIQGLAFTAKHCLDVLKRAILLLKGPASLLLFLWILMLLMVRLSHALRSAFAPLCYVPGISSLAVCTAPSRSDRKDISNGPIHGPRWADYPRLVNVQSATFEQLLGQATGGLGLSLEIKMAEIATADLVTLVRASDLRSRDVLADTLTTFMQDAQKTSRGLQKFNSKLGGSVDKCV